MEGSANCHSAVAVDLSVMSPNWTSSGVEITPAPLRAGAGESCQTRIDEKPICTLHLALPERIGKRAHVHPDVEILNTGTTAVTLVVRGDGSEWGWRTPFIGWSILSIESTDQHPRQVPLRRDGRCGNVSPFGADEILMLRPSAIAKLNKRIGQPRFADIGKYRVVFFYSNVPDLKHMMWAPCRVKESTPISLVSNEVIVEVTE